MLYRRLVADDKSEFLLIGRLICENENDVSTRVQHVIASRLRALDEAVCFPFNGVHSCAVSKCLVI